MDRRGFLRRAGTTSVALGATALIGVAAGCSTEPHHASGGPTTTPSSKPSGSTSTTTLGPPNWSELAATLSGTLVLPSDASYATDALNYNQLVPSHPAAIAYCASPTDVQRCVTFARQHKVDLAARSGGHSYAGYSSSSGLIIDVSNLNQINVAPSAAQATIGAGAHLIDIYNQVGAAGFVLPGGSCPTVGIAGLALGGGIGVFGRAYGMTCDNIASLQVVTADGSLRTCSPSSHSDLYWASRGGGGGNFGVVTQFTFTVHPMPDITLFTLTWPWGDAESVLGAWLNWMPSTPNELWANCQLASDGVAGGETVKVTGVYAGSVGACSSALAPFLSAVGSTPSYRFVGPEEYTRAMLIEAGCEDDTVAQCHLAGAGSAGTLSRSSFTAKSSYVNQPLQSAGTTAVISAVESLASTVPGVGGGIVFDGYGGAINHVAAGDTAFVHRAAIACAQYSVNLGSGNPASSTFTAVRGWLEQTQTTFAPYAQGSYQNYIDPTLTDWAQAYYGSNLPRLMGVKGKYDPDDIFHFAQSIPLST
jgi:hypothetical protein